jgi:hypothetical protein
MKFTRHIFKKSSFKFYESLSSRSRVGGQTDGRRDMAKVIVAFRDFSSAPKKCAAVPLRLLKGPTRTLYQDTTCRLSELSAM